MLLKTTTNGPPKPDRAIYRALGHEVDRLRARVKASPWRSTGNLCRSQWLEWGYSAAITSAAASTRAAQNLNSGILPTGSRAGLVRRLAAASA